MKTVNENKIKSKDKQQERYEKLLNEKISRIIPTLAIPTILSMMITSIYNIADTFFVSQLGTSASGAVGIIFSAMSLIQALSFTIGMGSGNYVARCLGAGQEEEAQRTVSVAFFTGFFVGTIIGMIGITHIEWIVVALGATETIKPYAIEYARYIFFATPFMMCSYIMNNLLRLQGLAAYAVVGIGTGGLINMALDPLFIFVFHMGTAGAAMATGLSQFISFVILICQCNLRSGCIHIRVRNFRPGIALYRTIIGGGMPSLMRNGTASMASLVLNTTARPYGDAAIAAMAIVNRLIYFINAAVTGLGQGFQPVCGFSYGARKYDRVREAFWFCVKVSTCGLIVISAAMFLVSGNIISLFRKNDAEVIAIGTRTLRFQLLTVWTTGFLTMSNMLSQSIGYGYRATFLAVVRQGLFLIPILIVFTRIFGLLGIQIAQPCSDLCAVILTVSIMKGILKELNKKGKNLS